MRDLHLDDFNGTTRLFPLGGAILFPHAVLPLHIFEPRYRQMMGDALAGDKLITIIQPTTSAEQSGHCPTLEKVGCLGRIIQHERFEDGRFNLLLAGMKRVRLVEELTIPGKLYRTASVEIIEDERPEKVAAPSLVEMSERFLSLLDDPIQANGCDRELRRFLVESRNPCLLTDLICQALSLPPAMKQILLEENDVPQRVEQVLQILRLLTKGMESQSQSQIQAQIQSEFPPKFSVN